MAIYKKYSKAYEVLIAGIEQEGFEDCSYYNPSEPIQFCYDRFLSEYGYRVKRIGFDKALTEWLQGLAIKIPFWDDDIQEIFNLTDKQVKTYFNFMAMRLMDLFKSKKLI